MTARCDAQLLEEKKILDNSRWGQVGNCEMKIICSKVHNENLLYLLAIVVETLMEENADLSVHASQTT